MILTDSGPLIALVNKRDPYHAACFNAARSLPPSPRLTTWPCFTEAMYFLYEEVGYTAQSELWKLRGARTVLIHSITEFEADRMAQLMNQYRDTPMDVADASLVAVAETLSLTRVFTIDSHFRVYRIAGSGTFEVIPGPEQ